MSDYIRFGFTALNGTNKTGTLRPDDDGYYEVVLGGLDIYNSVGQYYPYQPAKDLFTNSSQLMRRVSSGSLRGEWGHPKLAAGQSYDSFAQRILSIYESEISHHIREVTIDFDRVKDAQGRKVIAIIGKIKPDGPRGPALQAQLENKHANVCFSIRAFTRDDQVGRQTNRVLKNIVTWDAVNEPGLAVANKWSVPALEEISDTMFSRRQLERSIIAPATGSVALESVRLNAVELFSALGWDRPSGKTPSYLNW